MPGNEDDLRTVQAERAGELTSAPEFASLAISAAGKMVSMETAGRSVLVRFRHWMPEITGSGPIKPMRGLQQAQMSVPALTWQAASHGS
jgi:hypothetical protein